MKLNVKKKLNAVIEHVKDHPTVYAVSLALVSSAVATYVYNTKKGMVYMDDVTKEMLKTGKGMYFRNKKTGVTVISVLYNPETMKDLKFLD